MEKTDNLEAQIFRQGFRAGLSCPNAVSCSYRNYP